FIIYEAREEHPILNTRLFSHNPTFAFSNLAALINYSATFAVGFLLSLHLQVVVGHDSQTAGLILLSQPVIMTLLSPLAGSLSDRVEPRLVASWGMAVTALGLFIFSFLTVHTSTGMIMINLMLLGVGFALFASPNTNAALGSIEKRFYGVASSTLGTMRLTGQAFSMALVTMIISFFFGNVQLSPEYAELLVRSTRTSFSLFALLCLVGIFASLARGRVGREAKGSDGLVEESKAGDHR
ncbi:MAG: MFS transporter, partial [Syntrophomonadaceae bacterium]|nr:MFS transporter [Syntrophomonadaceae bacterium]